MRLIKSRMLVLHAVGWLLLLTWPAAGAGHLVQPAGLGRRVTGTSNAAGSAIRKAS